MNIVMNCRSPIPQNPTRNIPDSRPMSFLVMPWGMMGSLALFSTQMSRNTSTMQNSAKARLSQLRRSKDSLIICVYVMTAAMETKVSTNPGTSLTYSRGISGSFLYATVPQRRTAKALTGTRIFQFPCSNPK